MILAADAGGSTCRLALEHEGRSVEVRLGAANVTTDFDGAVATLVAGLAQRFQHDGVICPLPLIIVRDLCDYISTS